MNNWISVTFLILNGLYLLIHTALQLDTNRCKIGHLHMAVHLTALAVHPKRSVVLNFQKVYRKKMVNMQKCNMGLETGCDLSDS